MAFGLLAAGAGRAEQAPQNAVRQARPAVFGVVVKGAPDGQAPAAVGLLLTRDGVALALGRDLSAKGPLEAVLADGQTRPLVVSAENPTHGVALVRVKALTGLPWTRLSAEPVPDVGDLAYALVPAAGGPLAFGCTVAREVTGPDDDRRLVLDRTLPGPAIVLDEAGAAIAIAEPSTGAATTTARHAQSLFLDLREALSTRPHLGLDHGATFGVVDDGLLVERIRLPSMASRAGVARGDVVTAVGLLPVRSPLDVWLALAKQPNAASVPVKIKRRGATRLVFFARTVPATPDGRALAQSRLGVAVDQTLVVQKVTPAAGAGLLVGDRILRLGRVVVHNPDELGWALSADGPIEGLLARKGAAMPFTVPP